MGLLPMAWLGIVRFCTFIASIATKPVAAALRPVNAMPGMNREHALTCAVRIADRERRFIVIDRDKRGTGVSERIGWDLLADRGCARRGHKPGVGRAGIERNAEADVSRRDDRII